MARPTSCATVAVEISFYLAWRNISSYMVTCRWILMMWGCLPHSSRSTSASKRWRASMAPSAWCQGRRNWTGIAELRKSQLSGGIQGSFLSRQELHFFVMWEFCMVGRQIGANRPDIYHPSSTYQVSSEPRKIQRCFHRADLFHGTSTKHYQRGCNISVRNWLQRKLTQDALTQMIKNHGKAFTGTELGSEELVMIEDPMLSMKDCREVPEIAEMPSEKREGSVTPSNAERYRFSFSQKWDFFGWLIIFTITRMIFYFGFIFSYTPQSYPLKNMDIGRKGHRCLMITYLVIGLILLLIFVTAAALFASWLNFPRAQRVG